jgi:hypothetical protein
MSKLVDNNVQLTTTCSFSVASLSIAWSFDSSFVFVQRVTVSTSALLTGENEIAISTVCDHSYFATSQCANDERQFMRQFHKIF